MKDEEVRGIIDGLYPKDKERWFKIKILDQDKAMKAFPWNNGINKTDLGYELMAIGIRDEYVPQVNAMMDMRDDVLSYLSTTGLDEYQLNNVKSMLTMHIENLKQRVIETRANENV